MISDQDFDRLSAYIDNQLSPAEKSALDARLGREPELKAVLLDLRRQTRALRSLPRLKPPRSFTLTPAQAQALRRPRVGFPSFFPALRLATSLSAAAFAILTALSVMAPAARPVALAPAQESASSAMEAAPAGAGAAGLAAPEATPGLDRRQAVTTDAGADSGAPTEEVFSITGLATPEASVEAFASEAPAAAAAAALPAAESAPTDAAAKNAAGGGAAVAAAPDAAPPAGPTPLQWSAIGFGALTVILAALTWFSRRR